MNKKKKKSLGKGLSALLEDSDTDITSPYDQKKIAKTVGSVAEIDVESIEPNPFQPREEFDKDALQELADSIEQHGIIQPITVRKLGYDQYQIISGERRHRAAQLSKQETIPAYIRVANDQTMLEMALIENIQREDLDAIEVALSYQRLIDECDETQENLSKKVGKKRTTITNYLRLLKLPAEIQKGIRDKAISMGHARTLISIDDPALQSKLYQKILQEGLSVRKTEELVRGGGGTGKQKDKQEAPPLSFTHQKYLDDLSSQLDTKVDLKKDNKGTGKLVISFNSDEDLERIIKRLDL